MLWQFPSNFKADPARLADFLEKTSGLWKRQAFEFRDESWLSPGIARIMKKHGAAYCLADWPEFYRVRKVSDAAPFVYVRRHGVGPKGKYRHRYSDADLRADARRVRAWRRRRKEVFVCFNNDYEGNAIDNARTLEGFLAKNPKKRPKKLTKRKPRA